MSFPLHRPRMSLFFAVVTAVPMCLALSAPALADIKINEVESDGAGDFIELVNTGAAAVDVGGYQLKDEGEGNTVTIPAPTIIPAGGVLAFDTPGLGQPDTARVFDGTATLIDSFSWIFHASATTYGRCPDGTGVFFTATAVTKGAANSCISPLPAAWPGSASVTTVDAAGSCGTDLSGLEYEGTGSRTPGVLWGVNNAGSRLLRLVWNGSQWVRDTTNGWSVGKTLRFADGLRVPDSEGVTLTDAGSAGGVFVSSERDLTNNATSLISIHRYDVSGVAPLTATMEWNLTPDIVPPVGANSGAESVEWVPDAHLVNAGLVDQSTAQPYDPTDYPGHGAGLFFVGIEGGGSVYAYALNQTNGAFNRIATFASGFTTFGALHWDSDQYQLWVVCDNNCDGRSRVFAVGAGGNFALVADYARPAGMPNTNNEGFAITPDSECVGGSKPVYWADDGNFETHVLRASTIPCTPRPNDLLADFGAAGLYQFLNNTTWSKITSTSPAAIDVGNIDGVGVEDIIAGVAGNGLWGRINTGVFTKLHPTTPVRLVIADLDDSGKEDILLDYGVGAGLTVRLNNTAWVKINATSSQALAVGDLDANDKDDVLIDFGVAGLWIYFNNATWLKIDPANATHIAIGDFDGNGVDDIAAELPSGIRARYNNAGGWTLLNATPSQDLAAGDIDGNGKADLLIDFGVSGLWARYNNATWLKLRNDSPTNIIAVDLDSSGKDEVVIDLGAGGLWAFYNNTNWVKLSGTPTQDLAAARFD